MFSNRPDLRYLDYVVAVIAILLLVFLPTDLKRKIIFCIPIYVGLRFLTEPVCLAASLPRIRRSWTEARATVTKVQLVPRNAYFVTYEATDDENMTRPFILKCRRPVPHTGKSATIYYDSKTPTDYVVLSAATVTANLIVGALLIATGIILLIIF